MKMQKMIKSVQYVISVYALVYTYLIIISIVKSGFNNMNAVDIGVYPLFLLFLIGFLFSWVNRLVAGVALLLWNSGMWIFECFLVEKAGGFGIIAGVPLLIFGVIYISSEYKIRKIPPPTENQQWKLTLRLLGGTYAILYIIWVICSFVPNQKTDLFIWPGIILTILLGIYMIGFILSWRWELIAGVLFIIWYIGLFTPDFQPIAYNIGPLKLFGLPVLIQGFLYLYYHFIIKAERIHSS